MTHDLLADRLDTLLVIRLALPGRPPDAAGLAKLTRRFKPTTLGDGEWRARIDDAERRLVEQQVITAERRLTRADEVARRIGAQPTAKWEAWAERLLPALALGIRPDDAKALRPLSVANGWIAAIAARALGVWTTGAPPTLSALSDAMVWRALGLDGAPQPCPPAVRAYALRKHIAVAAATPVPLVRQIASKAVGAPNTDLGKLRDSVVRQWLVGPAAPVTEPAAPAAAPSLLDDLRRVVAAATGDAVFGDRKIFISRAWDALRARPAWSALALADFKHQLLALHREQAVVLARADLVAAMDPALVEASETRTDGASFHFIVRQPSEPAR
jgi:hypothetical protein